MGEQHAEGDRAAPGIGFVARTGHELRNGSGYGCIKLQQSAFVEDHRHGCCGDYFGDGRQIEESGGGCAWRICFVSEMAEGLKSDESTPVGYCDGSAGKDMLLGRFAQERAGGGKVFVLMVESSDESKTVVQGGALPGELCRDGL